ncbi:Na+/H+ antiporter subunit E [Tardiphaga sp. 709]|uniref:Na+/H+ antiporter subunit E n=1 Tax=Tardiphaga sp. 709 TaxID=3076039 RepID=UPI0028E7E61B|nr:Na+/H+ antiporter subunit E [Tardiphaga sp. 709]WNV07046.1 Na+/H+ antiporter subunit E [Tardiphaga sp. 709]
MNLIGAGNKGEARWSNVMGSAVIRAIGFFCFWLVLTRGDPADLGPGLIAAAAATWASLKLLPVEQWGFRPIKFAGFVRHFLHQSIVAGVDVALRALHPRLPLQPGFVAYQAQLPPGRKRNTFCAIMSLMPGTLPCGTSTDGSLAIHCLDVTQPVVEQLSMEETLCMGALGSARSDA